MTYAVLAPEHPLVDQLVTEPGEQAEVERFRAEVLKQSEQERGRRPAQARSQALCARDQSL